MKTLKRNAKKISILLTLVYVLLIFTACGTNSANGSDTSQESTKLTTEPSQDELKKKIEIIYNNINSVNKKCDFIVATIHDNWESIGFNLLFDKAAWYEKKDGYIKDFQNDGDTVFKYREDIPKYLEDINNDIKELDVPEELDDLYNALKNLYVNVNAYANTAIGYPDGYSLITYTDFYNTHQKEYKELAGYVDLGL